MDTNTLTWMTDAAFDLYARMCREVATTVLAQSLDELKLLRLMREIEARLREPQLVEERAALDADYALASALRAYLEAVREYAQ